MYKIFRLRKDGTFGSLFVDRKRKLEKGTWYIADMGFSPTGLAIRPGWHMSKFMPKHLSLKGDRVLCRVEYSHPIAEYKRPKYQGGVWVTALWIKIIGTAVRSARSVR